jgi:TPR repeat protein
MRISSDGVHQDFQAARTWYKRHYESTNDDLSALGLAKLHFKGHGVELDLQRALGYLTPHLVSGDARLNMLAGRILSARDSSTFDCQGGIEQFKLAVMKGNSYARKFLGWTYVEQGKYISGSFQLLRGAAEVFWFALRGKEDRVRPY